MANIKHVWWTLYHLEIASVLEVKISLLQLFYLLVKNTEIKEILYFLVSFSL